MKLKKFTYIVVTILSCLNLSAQREMNFTYEHSTDFKYPVRTQVILRSSSGKIELYSDTLKSFKLQSLDYFQGKGIYTIEVKFENDKYKDSISYDFEISGMEIGIDIDLSFSFDTQFFIFDLKKRENPLPRAFLKITRYYKSNSVEIAIAKVRESNKAGSLKGPFFAIINNSNDTIYGEYHPNYLWGTLSVLQQDSTWRGLGAELDSNFAGSSPLYPGRISLATVGSFGYSNNLPSGKYKYILLYTTKNQSRGPLLYKENESCVWYVGEKEFYKLIFEYEKK